MPKIVLFQTIQFSISTQYSSIWLIGRTLLSATTMGQTWEQWQWKGTLHSPKHQHYWSPTIRFFSVISRTFVVGVLLFCRDAVGVFCSPSWLSQFVIGKCVCTYINTYIHIQGINMLDNSIQQYSKNIEMYSPDRSVKKSTMYMWPQDQRYMIAPGTSFLWK